MTSNFKEIIKKYELAKNNLIAATKEAWPIGTAIQYRLWPPCEHPIKGQVTGYQNPSKYNVMPILIVRNESGWEQYVNISQIIEE